MGKNIAEQVFAEELALIENEALKVAVTRYLNEAAPSYFWTAPSSSSGKHHSRFDAGEGGLVRHTKMTIDVCMELLRLSGMEQVVQGEAIAALLIHDSVKNGMNGAHYRADHPRLAAERWYTFVEKEFGPEVTYLRPVFYYALWHSGQWSGPSIRDNFERPQDLLAGIKVVHLSDYIASRNFFNKAVDFANEFI